ncbi:Bug family tripartite tricarboxylate transporter substrate binding protein [Pseudorhodoferax sp.]|uniref:Bug family tripartite tricarboxylate transporter substrate binding protein n=1 Tax=Pseudorhodoferax sp. TaxID=1993553 RepID=UPI0039E387C3
MVSRRQLLQALPALPSALGTSVALAQPIAGKPIRLMVAASPGATVDAAARFVSEPLSKMLGVPVIVENRPGAGGAIGSDAVAKSPADGHTLLFTGVTHFSARYSGEASATYDPVKDFSAIARICSAALAVVVATNSPYKTLADLLAAMKAKPGEIDYGSGGVGSTSHLCTVIMNDLTGTKAKHIPYKGNTQAVTDTVAGVVAFTCQGSGGVVPLIKAGRLRALAVTSRNRWEALPDVPTGIESGIPGFEVASWMGSFAPAKTPQPMVSMVSDAMAKIARSPEFKAFCDKQSMYVELMEHSEFQASVPAEDARWRRVAELIKRS